MYNPSLIHRYFLSLSCLTTACAGCSTQPTEQAEQGSTQSDGSPFVEYFDVRSLGVEDYEVYPTTQNDFPPDPCDPFEVGYFGESTDGCFLLPSNRGSETSGYVGAARRELVCGSSQETLRSQGDRYVRHSRLWNRQDRVDDECATCFRAVRGIKNTYSTIVIAGRELFESFRTFPKTEYESQESFYAVDEDDIRGSRESCEAICTALGLADVEDDSFQATMSRETDDPEMMVKRLRCKHGDTLCGATECYYKTGEYRFKSDQSAPLARTHFAPYVPLEALPQNEVETSEDLARRDSTQTLPHIFVRSTGAAVNLRQGCSDRNSPVQATAEPGERLLFVNYDGNTPDWVWVRKAGVHEHSSAHTAETFCVHASLLRNRSEVPSDAQCTSLNDLPLGAYMFLDLNGTPWDVLASPLGSFFSEVSPSGFPDAVEKNQNIPFVHPVRWVHQHERRMLKWSSEPALNGWRTALLLVDHSHVGLIEGSERIRVHRVVLPEEYYDDTAHPCNSASPWTLESYIPSNESLPAP